MNPTDQTVLTPAIAQYLLWRAVTYLQFERCPENWPFYPHQPTEQAIRLLIACVDRITEETFTCGGGC